MCIDTPHCTVDSVYRMVYLTGRAVCIDTPPGKKTGGTCTAYLTERGDLRVQCPQGGSGWGGRVALSAELSLRAKCALHAYSTRWY